VGATTAFFAATIGLVQNDIKRVIAYSTCSQLGYMFVALGLGAYSAGIFHLFTHAFFKALLFLGAGSVIHAMHHEQDMRHMGGLRTKIPFTFWMMTIGTLALTGFPFTAGYYSKDAIIEAAYAASGHSSAAVYAFLMTVIAAGMTSFYSWRLVFMTFFGAPQAGVHHDHAHAEDHAHEPHESPLVMLVPLALLAFGALFAGLAFEGHFIGHAYDEFWKKALYQGPANHILHEMHDVPHLVGYVPFGMMVTGFLAALYVYVLHPGTAALIAKANPQLYRFLLNKWYFDELYDFLFVRPALFVGRVFWKGGDGWIIDRLGPDGISLRVLDATQRIVKLQTGYIYHYAFAMLIGVAALITYYLLGGVR
jgi:NADH-quinone oxidoreductase subunit L